MAHKGVIVSRQHLYASDNSSRSSSPDADLRGELEATLKTRLDLEFEQYEPSIIKPEPDQDVQSKEEEVEFRLFARSQDQPAKIKLGDQLDAQGPAGFVVPSRPSAYYFHQASQELKMQLNTCTLSGEQVKALRDMSWPGCTLPWRVTKLDQAGHRIETALKQHAVGSVGPGKHSKARPGKKVRIARRKAQSSKEAAIQKAETEAQDKEAALRAKKTRRNREKKVKRKEKEKAAKLESSKTETGLEISDIT